MQKILGISFAFCMMACTTAVYATTYATVTLTPVTLKENISFRGCAKITSIAPSSATYVLDDNGTFVETIDSSTRNGFWSFINATEKKIQMTYSGSAVDGSGSWNDYANNIDTLANIACSGGYLLRPSLHLKKFTLALSATTAFCGTAKMQYQADGVGYNSNFDLYGAGKHTWSGSGTFCY